MTAMVSGLDDGDEPHSLVALEAMVGLARLLDLVEPWDLRLVLLHTTIRIRPFFDSVSCRIPAVLSPPSARQILRECRVLRCMFTSGTALLGLAPQPQ